MLFVSDVSVTVEFPRTVKSSAPPDSEAVNVMSAPVVTSMLMVSGLFAVTEPPPAAFEVVIPSTDSTVSPPEVSKTLT